MLLVALFSHYLNWKRVQTREFDPSPKHKLILYGSNDSLDLYLEWNHKKTFSAKEPLREENV